jgi:hypothetical protein
MKAIDMEALIHNTNSVDELREIACALHFRLEEALALLAKYSSLLKQE